MGDHDGIEDFWLTVDGQVISPDAPAGGGGAGSFRVASGPFGDDPLFNPALPPPDSPASRYFVMPILLSGGDPLEGLLDPPSGPTVKPPPITRTGPADLWVLQDENNDVDVKTDVLDDNIVATQGNAGETDGHSTGLKRKFPTFDKKTDVKDGKITKLTGKFFFRMKFVVQTHYKTADSNTFKSGYGRGTTDDDVKNGDVSVGFHESCHRDDYVTFGKTHPLPVFTGKVGMTPAAFAAAQIAWDVAFRKWAADNNQNSINVTDEVGHPKESEYRQAQKQGKK